MKLPLAFVTAILTAVPAAGAFADGNSLLHGAPNDVEQVETLHVGPGSNYEILAKIRPGTSPRTSFCQYQGRWCYGTYGRWNGWFYGGENTSDRWTLRYLLEGLGAR